MTDQCRILSASGLSVWNGVVSCRSKSEHNSSNSADCRPQSKNLLPEKIMSVVCRLHWVPIFYWWQFRGLQTSLSTITLLVTVPWIADFTEYQYFTGDSSVVCRLHWVPILYWWQFCGLQTSLSTITLLVTVSWIADFTEYHFFIDTVPWNCRLHWVPLLYWYHSMKLQTSLSTITLLVTVSWIADFTEYHYFTGDSSVVCRLHWVPLLYWWQFHGLQPSLSTITLLVTVSWIADFTEYHYFTGDSFMDCRLHWVPLLYWYSSVKLRISQCNLFRASRVYFQKLQTSYESLWTSTWLRRLTWLQRHRTSFLSLGTVYSNTENWQCEPENCSAAFSAWTFRDTLSNYSR